LFANFDAVFASPVVGDRRSLVAGALGRVARTMARWSVSGAGGLSRTPEAHGPRGRRVCGEPGGWNPRSRRDTDSARGPWVREAIARLGERLAIRLASVPGVGPGPRGAMRSRSESSSPPSPRRLGTICGLRARRLGSWRSLARAGRWTRRIPFPLSKGRARAPEYHGGLITAHRVVCSQAVPEERAISHTATSMIPWYVLSIPASELETV